MTSIAVMILHRTTATLVDSNVGNNQQRPLRSGGAYAPKRETSTTSMLERGGDRCAEVSVFGVVLRQRLEQMAGDDSNFFSLVFLFLFLFLPFFSLSLSLSLSLSVSLL